MSTPYRLIFNPKTTGAKRIVFGPDGVIVEGNNRNENSWRLWRHKLELLALSGEVFSRFTYDAASNIWRHTNDADTLSVRDQYLEPER